MLYACDGKWWDCGADGYGQHALRAFGGEFWTQDQGAAERYRLRYIRSENKPGLSLDPGAIHQGQNGGYQAINLAVLFGARDIALLGYDMQHTGGRAHHHGDHPAGLNNPGKSILDGWRNRFPALAEDCRKAGVRVVNCTRETALDCFEKMSISEWRKQQST